jgi:RNA polymerase sigma-70 factor (ECF subfamily)
LSADSSVWAVRWTKTRPSRKQPDLFAFAAPRAAASDRPIEETVDADRLVRTLFTQEGAALVRLARLFTDDRNAAEDLVQEAFIRLHRSADRIRDPDRAAPYLRSILLNLARDHNRRGLMSLRHSEALTPAASPEAPEDRVILNDEQAGLIAALEELPARQRECLLLRFYFDLTEREIGATLDISPNSVKTHCRRGMNSLRRTMEVE